MKVFSFALKMVQFVWRLVVAFAFVTIVSCQYPSHLERQLICALDDIPCNFHEVQLRAALPEMILNDCKGCNSVELRNLQTLVAFVQSRYPNLWQAIVNKISIRKPTKNEQPIVLLNPTTTVDSQPPLNDKNTFIVHTSIKASE